MASEAFINEVKAKLAGLDLFVLSSLLPNVSLNAIDRGVWPFVLADAVRLGILIAVPSISSLLPRLIPFHTQGVGKSRE